MRPNQLIAHQSLRTATIWLQIDLSGSPSHILITSCRVISKYKCLQYGWNNKITRIKYRKRLLFSSLSSSCEVTSRKTAMLLELFMEPIKEPDSQSWLQGPRTYMVQRLKNTWSPKIVLEHQARCLNGPWGCQTESA